MRNTIRHRGTVEHIAGDCIKVKIMQTSACAGCKAASHCNASESKEKTIDIHGVSDASAYQAGDSVVVSVSPGAGTLAVILAFVIPFAILVLSVFACVRLTGDELAAALSGLGLLIPYYIILYLFRDKVGTHFSFTIEKSK